MGGGAARRRIGRGVAGLGIGLQGKGFVGVPRRGDLRFCSGLHKVALVFRRKSILLMGRVRQQDVP
jgi:hypothetical protein